MASSPFPEHAQIRRAEGLISADLPDSTVLLNVETGAYYGFEEVGERVWDLLKQPATLSDICRTLQQEFDVEPARCLQDVGRFLSDLAESRLIVVEPGAGA